jgi:hypothetical protein
MELIVFVGAMGLVVFGYWQNKQSEKQLEEVLNELIPTNQMLAEASRNGCHYYWGLFVENTAVWRVEQTDELYAKVLKAVKTALELPGTIRTMPIESIKTMLEPPF